MMLRVESLISRKRWKFMILFAKNIVTLFVNQVCEINAAVLVLLPNLFDNKLTFSYGK